MPAPDEVTQKHRRAQLALRAATLRDLLRLWPALDLNNIGKTWGPVEEALLQLARQRGRTSSGLAIAYLREHSSASGLARPKGLRVESVPTDEIVAGLKVVGAVNATKQLARGRPIREVEQATLVNLSGEVTRHVFNAGRLTLLASLVRDRGGGARVRRVTDPDPCLWCAGQASRTYSASARFPAHMHCACFPAPV